MFQDRTSRFKIDLNHFRQSVSLCSRFALMHSLLFWFCRAGMEEGTVNCAFVVAQNKIMQAMAAALDEQKVASHSFFCQLYDSICPRFSSLSLPISLSLSHSLSFRLSVLLCPFVCHPLREQVLSDIYNVHIYFHCSMPGGTEVSI